jgi:hypothetical protein
MQRTAYILTFDRDDNRNYKAIHNKIVSLPSVLNWSHYIKSSYILIASTDSATKLNNEVLTVFPTKRFLLMEVNLRNRNGRLPVEAWNWIKSQVTKQDE